MADSRGTEGKIAGAGAALERRFFAAARFAERDAKLSERREMADVRTAKESYKRRRTGKCSQREKENRQQEPNTKDPYCASSL